MHSPVTVASAMSLMAGGCADREVADRLQVPRRTIAGWRLCAEGGASAPRCPRCWRPARRRISVGDADYAELLGLYLGDGCVSRSGRTFALRISLDQSHPRVLQDTAALLERCLPEQPVHVVRVGGSRVVVLQVHSNHLPCLFPQHGPGKKHERPIVLERWQRTIVQQQPWRLLRGLIRSDGCVFVNRTGPYEYLSYDFANDSQDLLALFVDTCASVGVTTRRYERRVRVYRRDAVALLQAHVGVKG